MLWPKQQTWFLDFSIYQTFSAEQIKVSSKITKTVNAMNTKNMRRWMNRTRGERMRYLWKCDRSCSLYSVIHVVIVKIYAFWYNDKKIRLPSKQGRCWLWLCTRNCCRDQLQWCCRWVIDISIRVRVQKNAVFRTSWVVNVTLWHECKARVL